MYFDSFFADNELNLYEQLTKKVLFLYIEFFKYLLFNIKLHIYCSHPFRDSVLHNSIWHRKTYSHERINIQISAYNTCTLF